MMMGFRFGTAINCIDGRTPKSGLGGFNRKTFKIGTQ
jgi:hypothetical protein